VFAGAVLGLLITAGLVWSFHHPYGASWDEAQYLNEAQIDVQRLDHGMLLRLGGRILIKSGNRPPAYRLFALPVLGLIGFSAMKARLISLMCFVLSALFVYRGSRRIAGSDASAFSALVFCLSPIVAGASIWFSTEGPLYLATSAMMYFFFTIWTEKSEKSRNWIGLGCALGLGLLAKASFLAIAIPPMAYWAIAGLRKESVIRRPASQLKAVMLGMLIALPWWLPNIKKIAGLAKQARDFESDSLGSPSIETWARWLDSVCQCLLGYGLCIFIAIIVVVWIYKASHKKVESNTLEKSALWACFWAATPIVIIQLSGTNHLLRHISPAIIPMAIALGILASVTKLDRSLQFQVAACLLFSCQLLMILFPVVFPNNSPSQSWFANAALPWQVMARRDQWDLSPLLSISDSCGAPSPEIAYMGVASALNDEQIERPWTAAAGQTADATFPFPGVRLLWRYEEGPIDWQRVMKSADESDLVVTAPSLFRKTGGMDDASNENNAELATRLSSDPLFRAPIVLEVGRFQAIDLLVFVKKSLPCGAGGKPPAGE
jgi:Dolichyl-phosphate-mannose-protein mannosyltransferase